MRIRGTAPMSCPGEHGHRAGMELARGAAVRWPLSEGQETPSAALRGSPGAVMARASCLHPLAASVAQMAGKGHRPASRRSGHALAVMLDLAAPIRADVPTSGTG